MDNKMMHSGEVRCSPFPRPLESVTLGQWMLRREIQLGEKLQTRAKKRRGGTVR